MSDFCFYGKLTWKGIILNKLNERQTGLYDDNTQLDSAAIKSVAIIKVKYLTVTANELALHHEFSSSRDFT